MLLALIVLAVCITGTGVFAETPTRSFHFDMEAKSLSQALRYFGQVSGQEIIFTEDLVQGKTTAALKGDFTAQAALDRLLKGTGLIVERAPSGTLMVHRPQAATRISYSEATRGNTTLDAAAVSAFGDTSEGAEAGRSQSSSSSGLEEIIVTAAKRSQPLSEVPIAVQAVTGEELKMLGAQTFTDYARSLAGVQFIDEGSGRDQIFIRGVAAPQGYIGMESAIGVYLDDVPISEGMGQPDLNLYDIDHVEVLRGPQGTLYGSASLGGTVKIITNQPKMNVFEGLVDSELSGTERGGFNAAYTGTLNVPIVADAVALRAVLYGRNPSGFISNPLLGRRDVNSEDTYGGRVGLRIALLDRLTIDLKVLEQHTWRGGYNEADNADGGYVQLQQYRKISERFLDSTQIYNATVTYKADAFDVNSSTSYSRRSRGIYDDYTGLEILGNGALTPSYQNYVAEAFTQELRLSSASSKPFSWLVGAYFNRTSDGFFQSVQVDGAGAIFGLPNDTVGILSQSADTKQKALFGEAGYSPIDPLTFTVGVRVASIDLYSNSLRTGVLFGGAIVNADNTSQHPVAPKANISFKVAPDALVYAQVAKGYRIGGVNVTIQPTNDGFVFPKTYSPDSLWNYEVGFKGDAFDHRLTFDADVFYIDWKNIQVDLQHGGYDYFANAGNAVSKGVELQETVQATRHLEIGGQMTYTNARLTTTTPGVGNDGDRVPYVPQLSGSAFLTLGGEVGSGRIYGRVDVQHVGAAFTGFGEAGNFRYGDYTLTNLRFGMDVKDWRFAVFARNLFNTRAILFARDYLGGVLTTSGVDAVTVSRPRTLGAQVTKSF